MTIDNAVAIIKELGWELIEPPYIPKEELTTLEELEADTYTRAIHKYGYRGPTKVAKVLGVSHSIFYKTVKKLNINTSKLYNRGSYHNKIKD